MIDVNALVMSRVSGPLNAAQTRLDRISQETGLPFSAYMRVSVSAQTVTETEPEEQAASEPAAAPQSAARITLPAAASSYAGLISDAAARYGVDERLITALMFAESSFKSDATSGAGAMGLMQLMPYTAEALGVSDPYDPAQNIDGGTRLLASLIDKFGGDARLALAAYNCGAGRVTSRGITDLSDSAQRALLPSETRGYITKIEEYLADMGAISVLD